MASQSTRYFCCHFVTSEGIRAAHQPSQSRQSSVSRRTSLCRLVAAISNSVPDFQISPPLLLLFLCQIQGTFGWKPPQPTPVFALYNLDTCSNSHSFSHGRASCKFFNSSVFQGLSSTFCTLSSHCQCFAHSFLFPSQRSNSLASSSSFFKICAPPLHAVGFVNLCRSPALPSALLII